MRIPKKTRDAMEAYAQTLPPSSERAQCYTIANYRLEKGETIAQRISQDHRPGHVRRAMRLVVAAGAAQEVDVEPGFYGTFVFEDGSRF